MARTIRRIHILKVFIGLLLICLGIIRIVIEVKEHRAVLTAEEKICTLLNEKKVDFSMLSIDDGVLTVKLICQNRDIDADENVRARKTVYKAAETYSFIEFVWLYQYDSDGNLFFSYNNAINSIPTTLSADEWWEQNHKAPPRNN